MKQLLVDFTDDKSGDLLLTRRSERRYAELTHSLFARYAERGKRSD